MHTKTPTIDNRVDFDFYGPYRAVQNQIDQATSYILRDVSNYGATIYIKVGEETLQLTKKKIGWKSMVFEFYGETRDLKIEKNLISELKKHGLIKIGVDVYGSTMTHANFLKKHTKKSGPLKGIVV